MAVMHLRHKKTRSTECRKWIWIGIGFNVFLYIFMTQLQAVCFRMLNQPQRRAVVVPKEQLLKDITYALIL
jgi:hypothetical protein